MIAAQSDYMHNKESIENVEYWTKSKKVEISISIINEWDSHSTKSLHNYTELCITILHYLK